MSNMQQPYNPQQYQMQPPPKKKNWFLRHKILTALLVIVVIAIGATAGGSKSSETSSSSGSSASSGGAKGSASQAKDDKQSDKKDELAPIGTPVRDGKFEFTITKVERGVTSVGDSFMAQKAQGSYTLVYLTVANIGDKSQTMMDDNMKAMTSDGVQYSPDSSAAIAMKDNDVWLTQINPGNQVKGVLVFDAPANVKLTKIELHDSMFSGGVDASL